MAPRLLAPGALLAALLWAWAGPALAHKVNVFAVVQGGVITGEGYYANGSKARDCPVEVRDASGALAGQARTGADGSFSLNVPAGAAAPLTIVLKAGDGHQSDYTLTAKDLGAAQPAPPAATPAAPSTATSAQASAPATGVPAPAAAPALDEARLQALVEQAAAKALEGQLAPLRLELARLTAQAEGNRLRDIVGGLGWIMGLAGLAAWFKRRR